MKIYTTRSPQETKKIAKDLAKRFEQPHHVSKVFALIGELGSGKTTFVQGFAEAMGIKDKIISPTFVLIRQHPIPKTLKTFYHIDLYRLEGKKDLASLGLEEILNDSKNIILIEWAEKAQALLPKNAVKINFKIIREDQRRIEVEFN